MKFLFFLALTLASLCDAETPAVDSPELLKWRAQMTSFGKLHCDRLTRKDIPFDTHLADIYYDQAWVFYQVADFTKDPVWISCAEKALAVYKEQIVRTNGALPGYWLFSEGLAENWERNHDPTTLAAYKLLLANGNFVNASGWNDANQGQEQYMRETAYALLLHIQSNRFGISRNLERIGQLKKFLFGHLDQQFVRRTAPYRKPFMVGLAAHALQLSHKEIQPDPVIVETLTAVADYLRLNMWRGTGFQYTDSKEQGLETSPDLNLLLSPMYQWLYTQTKLPVMRTFGDEVFRQGVSNSYLTAGKIYNQNYRLSFPQASPPPVDNLASVCESLRKAVLLCPL